MLSADTLYNFTNRYIYFKNKLLELKFRPRFVLEDLSYIKQDLKLAFPMVCFCDILKKDLKSHFDMYGKFGIGLKQEWGIDNGLSCLCYIPNKSSGSSNSALFQSIKSIIQSNSSLNKIDPDFYNIIRYLKRYEGIQTNQNGKPQVVRFYDEREWRYVPPYVKNHPNSYFFLDEQSFKDSNILNTANQYVSDQYLGFKVSDIKILIVPDNHHKVNIINELCKDNKGDFKSSDYEELSTKIQTYLNIINN